MPNSRTELTYRRAPDVGENPFDGDKLDRRRFGEILSQYVLRMKFGAVLAIDAEWGIGKTWFGKNWAAQLEKDGHRVVYIDAFQGDYVEDPFVLIAAEIAELIEPSSTPHAFVRTASAAAKALAPLAVKTILQAGSKMLTGSAHLADEVKKALEKTGEQAGETFAKLAEDRISQFGVEKRALEEFRTQLQAFAAQSPSPVVVIIDELDRCRPNFAVNLLERVKHFFDVENVVFVLLINKKQFSSAIKGVYGAETDAKSYLDKFLSFTFTFPSAARNGRSIGGFINDEFKKYKIEPSQEHHHFQEFFRAFAILYELSLRQVERGVAMYAAVAPFMDDAHILAYLCVIKICRSGDYELMARGSVEAHDRLLAEARSINANLVALGDGEDQKLNFAIGFHSAWVNRGDPKVQSLALRDTSAAFLKRWLADLVSMLNISVS